MHPGDPPGGTGVLESLPLAPLLVRLDAGAFDGTLELTIGGRRHLVRLAGGKPARVRLAVAVDLLGRLLVDGGVTTEDRLAQALALQQGDSRRPIGEVLSDMGWARSEQIDAALREQVRRRLVRLFLAGESAGEFRLHPDRDLLEPEPSGPPVDPLPVLVEGIRAGVGGEAAERRVRTALAGGTAVVVPGPALERLALTGAEASAARYLARGRWDAGVFAVVPAEHRAVLAGAAYALLVAGALAVVPGEETAAESPPAAAARVSAPADAARASVSSGAAPAPAPDSAPPEESPERAAIRMEVQSLHERLARIDHFEILGVGREAGAEEIRAAYLARVKRFHPDRADILGVPELKEEMEELVLRLREAQEVLLDPEQRRRHLDESAGKAPVDDQARDVVDRAVAAENAYQMAVALERQRRLKEAEVSAMKAVERCPEQGEYRCMLYWLQMAGRAPNASVTDLAVKALDASAKAPAHERAQWQAGKILLRAGRTEQAAECFRRVVGRNPQNVEAARELRLIDMRSGKKGGGGGILAKLLGKK